MLGKKPGQQSLYSEFEKAHAIEKPISISIKIKTWRQIVATRNSSLEIISFQGIILCNTDLITLTASSHSHYASLTNTLEKVYLIKSEAKCRYVMQQRDPLEMLQES